MPSHTFRGIFISRVSRLAAVMAVRIAKAIEVEALAGRDHRSGETGADSLGECNLSADMV